ncbi:hypothetical protein GQ53DRAFT_750120 [Thozetella sp. PMI_491]|nr:hypothetical protein GQ53DRAFT_750120 [Thozetella sp. PMI_491]
MSLISVPPSAMAFIPSVDLTRPMHRVALVAVGSVAFGAAYLWYLQRSVSAQVSNSHATRVPRNPLSKKRQGKHQSFPRDIQVPSAVPADVAAEDSDQILTYERIVSRPVPASHIAQPASDLASSPSELLTAYIRTTMKAFTWTPQAFILRAMVPAEAKKTFDRDAIDAMDFVSPHLVTGVYRVVHRGPNPQGTGDQVMLRLEAPEGFRGPAAKGLILAEVKMEMSDSGEPMVVFVNETWMWRGRGEKPTLLEGNLSRWMHTLIISSMVVKGIRAVSKS